MNQSLNQQFEKSVRLLALEQAVRQAQNLTELSFVMVNSSQSVINDTTIFFWQTNSSHQVSIERVSNVANIDTRQAPLLTWLEQHLLITRQQPLQAADILMAERHKEFSS